MNKLTGFSLIVMAAAAGLCAVLMHGCEDTPAMADVEGHFANDPFVSFQTPVRIMPSVIVVDITGSRFSMRSIGGQSPHVWTVGSPSVGQIVSISPDTTIAIYEPRTVAANVITVTDAGGNSGVAQVKPRSLAGLSIIPADVVLAGVATGTEVQFLAVGGTPPYQQWGTAFPILGTIDSTGLYQTTDAGATGSNIVTVIDSAGDSAQASVIQTLGAAGLQVTPSAVALNNPLIGQQLQFFVTGGIEPYGDWQVSDTTLGQIDQDGVYTVLNETISGENQILITDSAGGLAGATVSHQPTTRGLQISPQAITVTDPLVGDVVQFTATGGLAPYGPWAASALELGTVDQNGLYTVVDSDRSGQNTITVVDSVGASAQATVTHTQSDGDLQLTPSSSTITDPAVGQTIQFTVTGGQPPYSSWAVSSDGLGTIDQNGLYTVSSSFNEGNNLVSVLDSANVQATATVTHQREGGDLSVVPQSASLDTNGEQADFQANGGVPPYDWSVVYPTRGHIVGSTTSATVRYERDTEGENVIVVTDANDDTASATITQENPTPPVIDPATASLSTNNTFVFSVAGGTSPYTWSVVTGTGTVNPTQGAQTTYTRNPADPPDNYVIRVTDANSQSGLATIQQD